MSTFVATLGRDRSIRAGVAGLILGALLIITVTFALNAALNQNEGVAGTRVSGQAPVVAFESFLREHVAREWAADERASVMVGVAAALREHLAREYRSVSVAAAGPGAGPLHEHLLREYRNQ
jgi:hypothetical protein